MRISTLVFASLAAVAVGLGVPSTTPVPILKQINQHNEDGSYSYGYEGADGSFKIETKYPTVEVYSDNISTAAAKTAKSRTSPRKSSASTPPPPQQSIPV